MQKIPKSIRLKKGYSESWPYVQRTQNPPDLRKKYEELLTIIMVFLPMQIVFGVVLYLVKSFLN